jgi:hypothetical protein
VQAYRHLDRPIGSTVRPVARVVHHGAQFDADVSWIDADVLACLPEAAGPTPDLTEEAAVKLDREIVGEDISAPASQRSPDAMFACSSSSNLPWVVTCLCFSPPSSFGSRGVAPSG